MDRFFLDFSNCKYISQVYREFKTALDLPDYFGENLDALFDCLRDFAPPPCTIEVKGLFDYARVGPHEANYVKKVLILFDDVQQENPDVRFVLDP